MVAWRAAEMAMISELTSPTQVLVLALVRCGLRTPYDLKSQAGMSVGQSSPVLKLLERARLLTTEPGPRGSLRYFTTEKGEAELRAAVALGKNENWWVGKFGVFESIPRAVLLAWLGSDLEDFPKWLGYAQEELLLAAHRTEQEAEDLRVRMERLRLNPSPFSKPILVGTTYRWMRTTADAALLKAQAELMDDLAPLLTDLPPAPQFGSEE
jgi:DNA-binding MarR family transcriptional regulator